MGNNTTMKELKENSIQVYNGMIAVWPHLSQESAINFDAATFNGSYSSNNGTLAFVIDNTLYVTPSRRSAYKALQEEGFLEKTFYVPFSNGDYPKAQGVKWFALKTMAQKEYEEDFQSACNKYCDEHGIGSIDTDILKNCFCMPANGVAVKHICFEDTYYPAISNYCLDCMAIEKLGVYCTNNGKVVFVYRDGKTYVAKGYKILTALQEAGYKEKGLFVPFSNGEAIKEPSLRTQWENIQKF